MGKVIPAIKPDEVPMFNSIREVGVADRKRWGLIMSNGGINDYRVAKATGVGGSRKEETFDPKLGKRGGHSCCGSKVEWRHKVSCPRLKFYDETANPTLKQGD